MQSRSLGLGPVPLQAHEAAALSKIGRSIWGSSRACRSSKSSFSGPLAIWKARG